MALSVVVFGAMTSATPAYDFHAVKWPGGVVPYYNAAPDQAWAVSQAVNAWNRSGAKVRFVAVAQDEAKLVIREQTDRVYCAEGHASVGYYPHGANVVIFPAHGITHACNRYWAARVMAHELGHVLGLQHENRYCAAMNATGNLQGGAECEPRSLWDWRCRLLESDDIAGAVAAYGGTPRAPSVPELCPLYKAIAPPQHLDASYDQATGMMTLSFRRPVAPVIPAFVVPSPWKLRTSFAIAGLGHRCSASHDSTVAPHFRWHARPLQTEKLTVPVVRGKSCFTVWAVDELGRPSATPATVTVSVE